MQAHATWTLFVSIRNHLKGALGVVRGVGEGQGEVDPCQSHCYFSHPFKFVLQTLLHVFTQWAVEKQTKNVLFARFSNTKAAALIDYCSMECKAYHLAYFYNTFN